MDVMSRLLLGEALRLELGLVGTLLAAEVLLLDLLELLVDVGIGHRLQAEVLELLLELSLLHEVLHCRVLELFVLRRPRLRERRLPSLVRALCAVEQVVEIGLRDRGVTDDGDRRRGDALRAAATGGDEQDGEQKCDRQEAKQSHVHPVRSVTRTGRASGEKVGLHAA